MGWYLEFDGEVGRTDELRTSNIERGHSAWEDAVDVARQIGVKLLLITHHSPNSDDEHLDRLDAVISAAMPEAKMARDGMEIVL